MGQNNIAEDAEYKYLYYDNGNLKRKYPKIGTIGLDTEYYENGNIKSTTEFNGNQWHGINMGLKKIKPIK